MLSQTLSSENSCTPFCFKRMKECQLLCKVNVPTDIPSKEYDLVCSNKCHEDFKLCIVACNV